jgi:hypothetical protein
MNLPYGFKSFKILIPAAMGYYLPASVNLLIKIGADKFFPQIFPHRITFRC